MAPIPQAKPKQRNNDEDESASSGENGEFEKSGSESESEEEENPSTPLPKKFSAQKQSQTPKKFSHPQSSPSDESHSQSDFPPRPDPKTKPIASKPMEDPPAKAASKKPRSKPGSSARADKSTAAGKLQAETENKSKRESKREKRNASVVEEDTTKKAGGDSNKKQLFQRLWSDDDQIAILMGMIEYTEKKGVEPGGDMNGFHEFFKKSLHVDVTKTQLYEKVRRLRKKYENNLGKGKEGKDPAFSKSHEQKAFELSKKIWGNSGGNGLGNGSSKVEGSVRKDKNQRSSVASPTEGEKFEVEKMETEIEVKPNAGVFRSIGFYGSIGGVSLDEEFVKDGLELISDSEKLELEGRWKKLRADEMEFYLKRVDLIREQTKLMLEVLRSSWD